MSVFALKRDRCWKTARSKQNVGLAVARWFSFAFSFVAFNRKEQRMIFPPSVQLLTHFLSSFFFKAATFSTFDHCSHNTSFQREMKDGAIKNVLVIVAKRMYYTHTSILSLGLTSSDKSFLQISQKLFFFLSQSLALFRSLLFGCDWKCFFFSLGRFSFKTWLKKCETDFPNFSLGRFQRASILLVKLPHSSPLLHACSTF